MKETTEENNNFRGLFKQGLLATDDQGTVRVVTDQEEQSQVAQSVDKFEINLMKIFFYILQLYHHVNPLYRLLN